MINQRMLEKVEEVTYRPCLAAPENAACKFFPVEVISDFWLLELWAEKLQVYGNLSWFVIICYDSLKNPL